MKKRLLSALLALLLCLTLLPAGVLADEEEAQRRRLAQERAAMDEKTKE